MDIRLLLSAITESIQPGSPTRQILRPSLEQLLHTTRQLQKTTNEPISLLSHITLVSVRLFAQSSLQLTDRERELTLECLQTTVPAESIKNVHSVIIDHLARILVPLFAMNYQTVLPEPTRLLAIKCWSRVFANILSVRPGPTELAIRLTEYVHSRLPKEYMAMVVSALLDNSELGKNQELRMAALDTLVDMFGIKGVLGDRLHLYPFFPGTVSVLARISLAQQSTQSANDVQKQLNDLNLSNTSAKMKYPAIVRARSLYALQCAVMVIYREPTSPATEDSQNVGDKWAEQAKRSLLTEQEVDADKKKDESNEGRLLHILWRLAGLRTSNHDAIRNSLHSLMAAISLECHSRQLQESGCFSVAIETCLVTTLGDTDYIQNLLKACQSDEILRKRILSMMENTLPMFDRYVCSGTEKQRLDVFGLLTGYMQVLDREIVMPLVSSWWTSKGMRTLLSSLSMSLPGTLLLISELDKEEEDTSEKEKEGIVLDNYRDTVTFQALDDFLVQIIRVLGLAQMCSQLIAQLSGNQNEFASRIMWVLTKAMSFGSVDQEQSSRLYRPLLQYCVEHFNTSDKDTVIERVLTSSVVLDTMSSVIPALGNNVIYYMDEFLFPLLQLSATTAKSNSQQLLYRQTQETLLVLARQTNSAGSISEMLRDNVDYIVEGCSQQLRSLDLHPHVFDILTGAAQLVGKEILVYMDDVVEDTIDVCEGLFDDDGQKDTISHALQFLEMVTRTIADASEKVEIRRIKAEDPMSEVQAELEKRRQQRQQLEDLMQVDFSKLDEEVPKSLPKLNEGALEEETEEDQGTPGNPLAIKITLAVQSFLQSEEPSQQLLALKVVQNTLEALTSTRDLLPLINQVWPILSHRLDTTRDGDQFYVTLAACDVADTVCRVGESWMQGRVRDDLWLHFRRVLVKGTDRELVNRVLRTMVGVVEYVPLDDSVAWDLSWLTMKCLDIGQKGALDFLKAMVPVYGDKIWLILSSLGKTNVDPDVVPNLGIPGVEELQRAVPRDICQSIGL